MSTDATQKTEKTWRTRAGYLAEVVRHRRVPYPAVMPDYRCGYVKVGKSHPLHSVDYQDAIDEIDVHGELTFSGERGNAKHWWFGYDCAHCNDTSDKCSLEFCIAECESLAAQLKALQGKKGEKDEK